jgi:hypothetical protein
MEIPLIDARITFTATMVPLLQERIADPNPNSRWRDIDFDSYRDDPMFQLMYERVTMTYFSISDPSALLLITCAQLGLYRRKQRVLYPRAWTEAMEERLENEGERFRIILHNLYTG